MKKNNAKQNKNWFKHFSCIAPRETLRMELQCNTNQNKKKKNVERWKENEYEHTVQYEIDRNSSDLFNFILSPSTQRIPALDPNRLWMDFRITLSVSCITSFHVTWLIFPDQFRSWQQPQTFAIYAWIIACIWGVKYTYIPTYIQ